MNIPEPEKWSDWSREEKRQYLARLANRLLCHRYRYYVLASPVIEDFEYDAVEKLYERLCHEIGEMPVTETLVGFDENRTDCAEAKRQVDAGEDEHSIWVRERKETEARIVARKVAAKLLGCLAILLLPACTTKSVQKPAPNPIGPVPLESLRGNPSALQSQRACGEKRRFKPAWCQGE